MTGIDYDAARKTPAIQKYKTVIPDGGSSANAEQVKEITGFTIGGVSPVGHLSPLKIYIDQSLERFPNIFGAAGHPNCVFKINFENLQKITNGEVKDIVE